MTSKKFALAGAVLLDLSKAFETLRCLVGHLNSQIKCLWFHEKFIKIDKSYLSNHWQRTKINAGFSSWAELLLGAPQGSVLGPLFFNICINDLFFSTESTNVCNYADDTTFHACDMDLENFARRLEHGSMVPIEWFEINYIKLNQNKCNFILSGHKYEMQSKQSNGLQRG